MDLFKKVSKSILALTALGAAVYAAYRRIQELDDIYRPAAIVGELPTSPSIFAPIPSGARAELHRLGIFDACDGEISS